MAYIVGLDLGQSFDYTALVILEAGGTPPAQATYAVRHLHRWPLDTSYPTMLADLAGLLARAPLAGRSTLVVDHTGVGRPVVDQIRQGGLACLAVSLHGGDVVTQMGANYRVPKRDLVGVVQVLLQQRRVRFAAGLPLVGVLTQELLNFKVTIDPRTAHDSYASWREKDHDDLVLALALACWWAEREAGSRVPPLDLSQALMPTHRGAVLGPRRVWRDELPEDDDPLDLAAWDEVKRGGRR